MSSTRSAVPDSFLLRATAIESIFSSRGLTVYLLEGKLRESRTYLLVGRHIPKRGPTAIERADLPIPEGGAMGTITTFDLDRFTRAAEERDAATQLSMYGPNAVVTIADKVSQP